MATIISILLAIVMLLLPKNKVCAYVVPDIAETITPTTPSASGTSGTATEYVWTSYTVSTITHASTDCGSSIWKGEQTSSATCPDGCRLAGMNFGVVAAQAHYRCVVTAPATALVNVPVEKKVMSCVAGAEVVTTTVEDLLLLGVVPLTTCVYPHGKEFAEAIAVATTTLSPLATIA